MNDIIRPYVPINCSFYDFLEEAATLGKLSTIEFLENGCVVQVESIIQTLVIKDKVEYVVLANNQAIRLDLLISFNGLPLPKSC